MYPVLLLSCLDDDDLLRDAYHALAGSGVAYIARRDNPSPYAQTDLNKWFRLTLRGG
jgi:hypothetical protein